MALYSGQKLGPYEIVSPLGAGGMGEVYRARDTRLDRTVAIKVLPSHLSANAELKQRFEREAKAISALQHPNICTLHDIGAQDGIDFLVMEYLEGQTLADRLAKGPLPLDQVFKIGIEIAEALEKAHRQGIVHRDLKPANIMLTKSGAKLMDFGLAKPELQVSAATIGVMTPSTPTMNLASLTVAASPLTQKGLIVGTFQYLPPEVLQGSQADARSDIFSLGCVLYEMAAGRRAFEGKSQLSVMTAILEKEPEPIGAGQPVPSMLDRIIRACLAKDPADRLQSAHDVAMDLRWLAEAGSAAEQKNAAPPKLWVAIAAALALACLALTAFVVFRSSNAPSALPFHAEIPPPEKYAFVATGDNGGMPVLSPQGDKLAFVAAAGGVQTLWVRSLSSDSARQLEGTEGASHPFWSPGGNYLGFFANGKLCKIPAGGGSISVLADAHNARGGSWSINDVILFAPDFRDPLSKVSAQGGPVTVVTVIDKNLHTTHRWPWFMPDGRHFIFLAASHTGGSGASNGLYFGSLDNPQTHLVVQSDSGAEYVSGRLLYRANDALTTQPFDPVAGKFTGPAVPVIASIRYDSSVWRSIFSASENGNLVYQTGDAKSAGSSLIWFDRSGKQIAEAGEHDDSLTDVRLSPDGKRVAFVVGNPTPGIWTLDLERKTRTRITFDFGAVIQPAWSPDGKTLAFVSALPQGGGTSLIRSKASDGSGDEKDLVTTPHGYNYPSWSPDGKYLAYLWGAGGKSASLWLKPTAGGDPYVILRPPTDRASIYSYSISPDSRWLAYVSDESGANDVYITSFPDGKGKWQVSQGGGAYPVWSGDGKELFYDNLADEYYVCQITTKDSDVMVGAPHSLFHSSSPGTGVPFDVSRDGKRILVNVSQAEATAPLLTVINWPAELKK